MNGIRAIESERTRQVQEEGYTPERDTKNGKWDLARAAACYAIPPFDRNLELTDSNRTIHTQLWPWNLHYWKPVDRGQDDYALARATELVKAGALIAAQLDLLESIHPGILCEVANRHAIKEEDEQD